MLFQAAGAGLDVPCFEFKPEAQLVRIEARLAHEGGWHQIPEFSLLLSNVRHPGSYIAYSNRDDAFSQEDRAKAVAELNGLMTQLQSAAESPTGAESD